MAVSTVNISFQEELLQQIDQIAQDESRSRSELIREAARLYIEKKKKWQSIFSYGELAAGSTKVSEKDVFEEIRSVRKTSR
jgi:metal-responsive CopG/Arc/MetJ family transcriptional regulator